MTISGIAHHTRSVILALVLLALCATARAAHALTPTPQGSVGKIVAQSDDAYIAYDESTHTWEIGTASISRRMDYEPNAGYRLIGLKNRLTGTEWLAPGSGTSAELRMELDGQVITGAATDFVFKGYKTQTYRDGSLELQVSLVRGPITAHLHYLVFPGTSVLEQWAAVENTGKTVLRNLTALDSFSIALRPSAQPLTLYWVQGLSPQVEDQSKSQPVPTLRLRSVRLNEGVGQTIGSSSRSSEDSMGWFALAATSMREGMFGGIKWSGAWQLRAVRESGQTSLRAGLQGIRHDLAPGEIFEAPRRFVGFYRGDLGDATRASHAFARKYLMRPRPANFPWTQFNTWFAFYTDIDEEKLKREVDIAAELGLEVFYVDAGWYEGSPQRADFSFGLGTWRENREKFPSGLAAFSDYVHSKGLKFGLWVEPERVDLDYVGLGKEIPWEWLAPGAEDVVAPEEGARTAQICLGHREAREWIKQWLSRLIRDYRLDWLKWDNNIWMSCDPPGEVGDANYYHVLGLYEILDYVRQEFPDLIIENCASGGNRMDYALMRRTDIAWLSDETDPSYRVRYHVFGASYIFPPEYLNSWLVPSWWEHLDEVENDPAALRAWLRSRMMGAFGISASMVYWSPEMRAMVATEIQRYKNVRDVIAKGRHFHLLPQSNLAMDLEPPTEPDATEFYDPATRRGVVFLFRGAVPWTERRVILRGLASNVLYEVTSADGAISTRQTGRQLMTESLRFPYEENHPSSLLFIKPVPARATATPTPTRAP